MKHIGVSRWKKLAYKVTAVLLLAGAGAQGARAEEEDKDWHFTIAPYVLGASLKGDAVVRGIPAEVDLDTSDILDHLDSAFMGLASARKGAWGVYGDVISVDLDVKTPLAKVEPGLRIATLAGSYRLSRLADLTVGARWTRVEGSIQLRALTPLNLKVEKNRDWVDPVVGVVLRTPGESRWHATLIADVGGFGVGSRLTYQVFPTVGFQATRHVSVELGWRLLSADYRDGSDRERFESDVRIQGPVAGFAFRF